MLKSQLVLAAIESIHVHWSESSLINNEMGCNSNFDIKKTIDLDQFQALISRAAQEVSAGGGYDKTKFTVKLRNGSDWGPFRIDINSKESCVTTLLCEFVE